MAAQNPVAELIDEGLFDEALLRLNTDTGDASDRLRHDVLRADLYERIGRLGQSRSLITALTRSRRLDDCHRSVCEFVLSRLEWEAGDIESSISHVQRSLEFAKRAGNLSRICWAQLRLVSLQGDRSGPESVASTLAELRANATKLGDPQVTAALHIAVGNFDGKRGLLRSAQRHTDMGQRILRQRPNIWLESWAENTHLALSILLGDLDGAQFHGARSLSLTERSGAAAALRTCLINRGNALFVLGNFEEAIDHFRRAMDVLPSASEHANASLESIARIRLCQGQIDECGQLLDRIEQSIRSPSDLQIYVYRNTLLTRIHFLARRKRQLDALANCESLIRIAEDAGDHLLHFSALLTKAELLQATGDIPAAMETLDTVLPTLPQQPPDLYAHYERILACALAAEDGDAAGRHFRRARRLYESIRSVPGLLELDRRWEETAKSPATEACRETTSSAATAARDVFQSLATLLRHHSRPELVARELVHLISETDAAVEARALSIGADDVQTLATGGQSSDAVEHVARRIPIGSARGRTVELDLKVRISLDAQATVHAVTLLMATIQDLERARAERETRMSLWPVDEDSEEDGAAVVGGQMRTVMHTAQRIASTNASVFITGESGTGKEIVARAIHRFSDRAAKPFLPFNCTAVPRDMLESQLFGYRRGSFTGADRDHAGMIGAARDGTLFLDEIGELGLDLQPKLLRFLESGEVCPLGESTPFIINVRIIAATNADIEQQVKDGRFREDLFYRLNVIRLKIPPLRERRDEIPALVRHFVAHSAGEFRKGDVRVSEETMEHLLLCRWPGNVRQLQNEIRRMIALADTNAVLTPADLSEEVLSTRLIPRPSAGEFEMLVGLKGQLQPTVSKIEREMIRLALRDHQSNLDEAALALGISRKGLYLKRQRLGL